MQREKQALGLLTSRTHSVLINYLCDFLKDFIYLFLVRGEGREGEKHQCVVASHTPPTGTWPGIQACALTGN